jgi:C4-dicarboxylate transporter DctQ subunit
MLTKIGATFDRAFNILLYLTAGINLLCFGAIVTEVLMRSIFNRPQIWVNEVSEYILLYTAFLPAAWLLREEKHINVDLVLNQLKPRSVVITKAVTSILGAMVCLVLTYYGSWSTLVHYQEGIRTFSAMRLPKWPFLMVIPFGSFLLFVQFVRRAYGCGRKARGL